MNRKVDKNWKVYIVAHDEIFSNMYENDPAFGNLNYEILNVGSNEYIKKSENINEIAQFELCNSRRLGKWWAESEGIYNLWRNGLHKNLDFIGFIHYDLELKLRDGKHIKSSNITERVNKAIRGKDSKHISFETHDFSTDYAQKILADKAQPNVLQGEGTNCYDYIIDDYNEYFGTSYTVSDLRKKEKINLCSCFLIDSLHFDEMMHFFEWVIDKGELETFDTQHKYRIQGGLAERYFGVYMALAYDELCDLSLIHHWNDGLKTRNSKICRVMRKDTRAGLFSFFNTTLGAIDYWKRRGYDVVVEDSCGHGWNELFENNKYQESMDSAHTESITSDFVPEFRPDDSMEILSNAELLRYWHQVYVDNCKVCGDVQLAADKEFEQVIGDRLEKTIGVLCRGTDYVELKPFGHPRQPEPIDIFPMIDKKMEEGYEFVYLVTEDTEILQKFQNKYGERLLIIPQNRVNVEKGEFLADVVNKEHLDAEERNRRYLIAILLLAKCRMLVAGRTSGTVATMIISEGFEEVHLWNRGRYGDEMEEKLKYKYK